MAKKSQWVQVGRRRLELSNLDKPLYPKDGIVKAEVIGYYHKLAPTFLRHAKGRPLTLVRFPDGVGGEMFFQKNRPGWAPEWIESVALGSKEEKKDYVLALEEASMVWLANLACLELHQMHSRRPHYDKPDYMVFDLDPPEGYKFANIVSIAVDLKKYLMDFGYHVFVKTTGGKGVHVVVPLEPRWDFDKIFETLQILAKPFVEANNKTLTLHLNKEARKGRVLIDIFRNRPGQTIISAYSLRGRDGAPVSTPLPWEELKTTTDPRVFNLTSVMDRVVSEGDPWESIGAYACEIHTERKKAAAPKKVAPSAHHKEPEQLKTYSRKRDFGKTPEPAARVIPGKGNAFVVHRHHATNLHYDLRLEQEGVLKSWAVPRGLPPRPGVKRLAVTTEDHPMEYLTFDGKIPKGQYGGGDMWIYALGRYEITKEKKDGFYFRLNSPEVNAEYRMYKTKEKEWLLERVDGSQVDWWKEPVPFMLADGADKIPAKADDYFYEVKWDGIRAMIVLDEGEIRIRSRNQRDITKNFPELLDAGKSLRATSAVFDAEIICLDKSGRPDFKKVISRLMATGETNIQTLAKKSPCFAYLFDCLYLDGRPLTGDPLWRRRDWFRDAVKISRENPYRVSEVENDGEALLAAAREHDLEGIMAKKKDGRYLPGKRSENWIKIKVRQSADCVIVGYTQGKGNRGATFGALQVAEKQGDEYVYKGKVGTGFDDASLKSLLAELKKVKEARKPFREKAMDEATTTWIRPELYCEVRYASLTPNKMFREPVFVRLRPDLG